MAPFSLKKWAELLIDSKIFQDCQFVHKCFQSMGIFRPTSKPKRMGTALDVKASEKTRKGLILNLLILSIFLAISGQAIADEGFRSDFTALNPSLLRVSQATVSIERIASPLGSSISMDSSGTGVIVGKSAKGRPVIATNGHVAGCPQGYHCTYSVTGESFHSSASIVSSKLSTDAVLLELGSAVNVNPVKLYPDPLQLKQGSSVMAVGFPVLTERSEKFWKTPRPKDYKEKRKRWSVGDFQGYRAVIDEHYPVIEGKVSTSVRIIPALRHSADNVRGNSGGPLAIDSGEVIGLVTGVVNPPSGNAYCDPNTSTSCQYYAVPSSVLIKMLVESGYSLPN